MKGYFKMKEVSKRVGKSFLAALFLSLVATLGLYSGTARGEGYQYSSTLPPDQLSYFAAPLGVAADSSGNVYVADYGNQRIQKFNSSGEYAGTIGVTGVWGSDNSHFSNPYGVAVDSSGNVYVADYGNQRIQKFNSFGEYKSTIGVTGVWGYDNSHFFGPVEVAVDASGNVYVSDR